MLKDKYFLGSVMNKDNHSWLLTARGTLKVIKEHKLLARHEKNNDERHYGTARAINVFLHMCEEVEELRKGLANDDRENILEEIADVINCAEILAMTIINPNLKSKE